MYYIFQKNEGGIFSWYFKGREKKGWMEEGREGEREGESYLSPTLWLHP